MTFDEEDNLIVHKVIWGVSDEEFIGYDCMMKLPDNDKFIKNTLKIEYRENEQNKDIKKIISKQFKTGEQGTWWNFPLYEIKNNKIISFDYTKYQYFANTDRRIVLGKKISNLYNIFAEAKIQRKTLKYIMDNLNIEYPDFFKKYNDKIEEIINKNLK